MIGKEQLGFLSFGGADVQGAGRHGHGEKEFPIHGVVLLSQGNETLEKLFFSVLSLTHAASTAVWVSLSYIDQRVEC